MQHRIKGRTCSLVLDLPNYLDESTRDVLLEIFSYCLDEESRDKVLGSVKDLLIQTRKLVNSLKKSKKHSKQLEDGIRKFIGIHLNHGFQIGSYYTPGEDGEELADVISDQLNYGKVLAGLPSQKKKIGETIFFSLDLARMAFETGLMLSYYLSEELVEQHQNELRKMSSYIG
ncbi:MAG TPA: hypothetical protein VJA47_06060 [archaeon]|nr:hypothetical protein [archaeon]